MVSRNHFLPLFSLVVLNKLKNKAKEEETAKLPFHFTLLKNEKERK